MSDDIFKDEIQKAIIKGIEEQLPSKGDMAMMIYSLQAKNQKLQAKVEELEEKINLLESWIEQDELQEDLEWFRIIWYSEEKGGEK